MIEIWKSNNHLEWTDLALSVVRELLINRLGELPAQSGEIMEKEKPISEPTRKYSRNRILQIIEYSLLALFPLFVISKVFLPDAGGGWSEPPIFDYIFLICFGLGITVAYVIMSYYSWIYNTKEYYEWSASQYKIRENWAQKFVLHIPDWYRLWSWRILGPIGALFGIGWIFIVLLSLVTQSQ